MGTLSITSSSSVPVSGSAASLRRWTVVLTSGWSWSLSKDSKLRKDHAVIWGETEVNWCHQAAASYRMVSKQCSTWWHRCAVLSSCDLSVAVFGLGVVCQCPFSFHTEREFKPLLRSISKAQYQVSLDVLHTTKFQQSLTLQLCVIFCCC